ncbi:MAG: DUF2269 family protein [Solirubrobacteraceae bacterium]
MLDLAVSFPDVVLAIHIVAVIVGFGASFAYPVLHAVIQRTDARALPALHRAQIAVGQRITGPALGVIVLAGLYLANHDHAFGQFWVLWGIAAAIVIGVLGALVIRPITERQLELAERDLASIGPDAKAALSPEYLAQSRRVTAIGWTISLLVLLTVFDMVIKPFG